MPIHGAPSDRSEISLDREGFALLQHETAVRDFWDEDEVRRIYYPEAEAAIAAATGASRVFIFDHTRRRRVAGADDRAPGAPRQPATRVHVDHTAKSGRSGFATFSATRPRMLLRGRVAGDQSLAPDPRPLARRAARRLRCRARSRPAISCRPIWSIANRIGETYAVTYNPSHRWFYVPAMQPDEALLIKCFELARPTAAPGSRRTPPSTIPTAPADVLPRESIENPEPGVPSRVTRRMR